MWHSGARTAAAVVALALAGAAAMAEAQAPDWQRRVDSLVTAELARTQTPGAQVAIVHRGRVVYSRGYGVADIETGRPVTAQTLFRVGSVTKMVTGAVAAELAEQGKLDLDAPIVRYVPELQDRRVGRVTAQQLLTHTAGWKDVATAFGRMGEGALGEVMREVGDTLFVTEPGRVMSYSNPGYAMMGYVLERSGGQRYGTLVERMVLRAMGMPRATFRPLTAMTHDFSQGHIGQPGRPGAIVRPFTENTAEWAAGYLMASAEEFARFTIALMDSGRVGGDRVLSAAAVARVTRPHVAIPGTDSVSYGYGLMLSRRGGIRLWQHGGTINGFDAMVTMLPDEQIAVLVFDNRSGPGVSGLTTLVARELAGVTIPPAPAEPAEREATPAERAALVGRYVLGLQRLEIIEEAGALRFVQNGMKFPLTMVGPDRIRLRPAPTLPPLTLLVVRDATGRVMYLFQDLRVIPRAAEPSQ